MNVDEEAVKEHFYGKDLGYADAIAVVIDCQHLHINVSKDQYYTVMLMKTHVPLKRSDNGRKWRVNREMVRFNYPEIICNHYTY